MSMFSFSRDMGIDFGTSRTRIYIPYQGIVYDEPSKIAYEAGEEQEFVCVGDSAEKMLGRVSEDVVVDSIVLRGAIQDEISSGKYMRHAIKKALHNTTGGVQFLMQLLRRDALAGIPTDATSMEQRTMIQTCKRAGMRNIFTEQNAILAAFGIGMHRDELRGRMIVDIGAGLTEVAVISLGGMSSFRVEKVGGR